MKPVIELSSIILILVYMAVVLTHWKDYCPVLSTPGAAAAFTVIVIAVAWCAPIIALFLIVAIAATYYVNSVTGLQYKEANGGFPENNSFVADNSDFFAPISYIPFFPSKNMGSNTF